MHPHSTLLALAQNAKKHLYTTLGKFTQMVLLSLAFERVDVDLSMLSGIDPETRESLLTVVSAFARGEIHQ